MVSSPSLFGIKLLNNEPVKLILNFQQWYTLAQDQDIDVELRDQLAVASRHCNQLSLKLVF